MAGLSSGLKGFGNLGYGSQGCDLVSGSPCLLGEGSTPTSAVALSHWLVCPNKEPRKQTPRQVFSSEPPRKSLQFWEPIFMESPGIGRGQSPNVS